MKNENYWFDSLKIWHKSVALNTVLEELPESLAKAVKGSDPTVWPILMTTNEIINSVSLPWLEVASDVGMIIVGNAYPKQYTQKVINELQTKGRVSPLSFINANAGAAISICCTMFKFQGPTINLTISDSKREKIAAIIASQWLERGDAKYIFFVIADFNDRGECVVTNKLISSLPKSNFI